MVFPQNIYQAWASVVVGLALPLSSTLSIHGCHSFQSANFKAFALIPSYRIVDISKCWPNALDKKRRFGVF